RKNLCKLLHEANQQPIEEDIQKPVQVAIQEPIQRIKTILARRRQTNEWKELGLVKYLKTENLNDCMTLCHDLEQYDPE
ncbi:12693_t:CDS:2, partial [Racocetra persica]